MPLLQRCPGAPAFVIHDLAASVLAQIWAYLGGAAFPSVKEAAFAAADLAPAPVSAASRRVRE